MRNIGSSLVSNHKFLSLIGNGTTSFFGFINFLILATVLEVELFGSWVYFLSLCGVFEMIRAGIIQTAIVKFTAGKDVTTSGPIYGSAWAIISIYSVLFSAVLVLLSRFTPPLTNPSGLNLFITFYPILNLCIIPAQMAQWVAQAEYRFDRILRIKIIQVIIFLCVICSSMLLQFSLWHIVVGYIMSHAITGIYAITANQTRIAWILRATKENMLGIWSYGKYTVGTLLGTNLLKNSDILLIGAFLGPASVAVYAIPLKFLEVIEIPVRSMAATAMTEFSKSISSGKMSDFRALYKRYAGLTSLCILPLVAIMTLLAKPVLGMINESYHDHSLWVFYLFMFTAIMFPMDRFMGVALDAANLPRLNMLKIILMIVVNILGDLVVIFMGGPLWCIAGVSVITFSTGMIMGHIFLQQVDNITIRSVFSESLQILQTLNKEGMNALPFFFNSSKIRS